MASPDGLVDGARLLRRLTAVTAALADLPRQARRLARWKLKREKAYTGLEKHLEQVASSHLKLGAETSRLVSALRRPEQRVRSVRGGKLLQHHADCPVRKELHLRYKRPQHCQAQE